MSKLQETIEEFRQALLAYDGRALGAVLATYEPIRQNLIAQIGQLLDLAGANPGADLWQLTRAQDLLVQIQAEMATLTAKIGPLVSTAQAVVINEAGGYQQQLAVLSATTPALAAEINATWNALPTSALADLVGRLSDGSPLNDWLQQFGAQTAQSLKESLTEGLALGLHPSAVAAQMAKETDIAGNRLALLARSTMLDSFRSASLANVAAQPDDVTDGWYWTCSNDETTCAACLALDGQFFDKSQTFFEAHLGCRCTPRPSIPGIDTTIKQSGADFFAGLSPEQQDATLGKAGGQAYRDGTVTLQDFVGVQKSDQWGDRFVQNSLKGALAASEGDGG